MSYHKRRKKGASSFSYRYRRNQKEGPSPAVSLPANWQLVSTEDDSRQYCKVGTGGSSGPCTVSASVSISANGTWTAFFDGKKIPATSFALSRFPPVLTSQVMESELISELNKSALCPGNPDNIFVKIYRRKGGTVKGNRGNGEVVAFVDEYPVVSSSSRPFPSTIRRVDCDIVTGHNGDDYPAQCGACNAFRSTLRSAASR